MYNNNFKVIKVLLVLLLLFSIKFAYADEQSYDEAKPKIDSVRLTDPSLPTTAWEQKGSIWYIISRLFDGDGKISPWFIRWLWWATNNTVLRWSTWNGWEFSAGSILDNGTNVWIWTSPNSYRLNVWWDINFTWVLRQNGAIFNPGWKFQDGATTWEIYYNTWFVGIWNTNPAFALDVTGDINATNFRGNGSEITNIDGNNISANTVWNAALINNPTFSELTFDNQEPDDLTVDGNLWFDSSRGLILYRTQEVWQESWDGTYTVLDTSNITWGDGINISNTAANTAGVESITFSVSDIDWGDITDGSITGSDIQNDTITEDDVSNSFVARTAFNTRVYDVRTLPANTSSSQSYDPSPNEVPSNSVSSFFSTWYPWGSWRSALTVKGWANGYAAWQIAWPSNASTLNDNFYIRSWVDNAWNSWNQILHTGIFDPLNINGANIQNDTITGTQIAANAITSAELAPNSVWSEDIIDGTVTGTDISNNTITSDDIATNAVWDDEMINSPTFSTVQVNSGEWFIWEWGVNRITHNDGGWNVQIRFGHQFDGWEIFTHWGTAFEIGWLLDSANGEMELKVATNGWAWVWQAVSWWPSLVVWQSNLTWGGNTILTDASSVNADTLDSIDSTGFFTKTEIPWLQNNSWDWISSVTSHGYINLWPANTSYAHIYTNMPSFYFNRDISILWSNVLKVGDSGDSIADGTIDSSEIQDNTITGADIAANSINGSELNSNAVTSTHIVNNTITETDISDSFIARSATKVNQSPRNWLWDLNGTPRSIFWEGLSVWFVDSSQNAPISYGTLLNMPSYTAWQDGSAGQFLFPYLPSYTQNGNPMFRTGLYNNAGWSAWKTMMDKDWSDSLYIWIGTSWDQIQDGTIDSSEIQNNTLTASDLAENSVGNSELNNAAVFEVGELIAWNWNGSVALTINDGQWNANLTFNHKDGTPDQNGNAARIVVNTDSSSNASMVFEVKSGVTGGSSVNTTEYFRINESWIDVNGDAIADAFVYSSDKRLKTNFLPYSNWKSVLSWLRTYSYDWKDQAKGSDVWVIAQDVLKVFPEAVVEREDWYLAVDYAKLVVPLIQTVQEQQKQIDELKKQVELLLK